MRLKFNLVLYLSKLQNRWTLGVTAVFLYSVIAVSAQASGAVTVEEKYPGLAAGVLKSSQLVEMSSGALLSADGFEVTRTWIEETINRLPPETRKQMEGSLFFMLEQEATRKVIIRDAKIAGIPSDGRTEDQIIQSYLTGKVARITVSDEEAKSFYYANTQMVGGLPFDQVKESIQGFLIQQKRQDAIAEYIKTLEDLKDIRINARWVKKQYAVAMDNPVDRARRSGKPTMVEFGAVGCVPCDMMQPILDKLRKTCGDRLNVVFVNVRENKILGARFGIRSIPIQVFYDRTGKEVFRHVGFFAEAEVNKQLTKLAFR